MLQEHAAAIEFLARQMITYFWLFPIGSLPIYAVFVLNNIGMHRAAWLFSISLPGVTLLPVNVVAATNLVIGAKYLVFVSVLFPAIWLLPLVFAWQVVDLWRCRRTRISVGSGILCGVVIAMYPLTSFTDWALSIEHGL